MKLCELMLTLCIGYMVYNWWKGTDQELFKTKYLGWMYSTPKKYTNREVRTNRILDKISKSGYKSLTPEEKDFLDNQKRF